MTPNFPSVTTDSTTLHCAQKHVYFTRFLYVVILAFEWLSHGGHLLSTPARHYSKISLKGIAINGEPNESLDNDVIISYEMFNTEIVVTYYPKYSPDLK